MKVYKMENSTSILNYKVKDINLADWEKRNQFSRKRNAWTYVFKERIWR